MISTVSRMVVATILLALASTSPFMSFSFIRPVEAVFQTSTTTWSPFGPRTPSLTITEYSGMATMFSRFAAGQIDITDGPVSSGDLSAFGANPDFFLTSPQRDLGMSQLDRNAHAPFLGKALQTARMVGNVSLAVTNVVSGCSPGNGRLVVNLKNLEELRTPLLDPLNKLEAFGQANVIPVMDDPTGGAAVDGQYVLPSSSTCLASGTYTLTTTVYSGSANVLVGSGQIVSAEFGVNYNSNSSVKPTPAFVEIGRAIAHLLDKPSFIGAYPVDGYGEYADVQAPPAQGVKDIGGSSAESRLSQVVMNEDCSEHPWKTPCSPSSGYNLTPDTISGASVWWGSDGYSAGGRGGYPGPDDMRAACDHFVVAGFTVAGGTCADVAAASTGNSPLSTYPHLLNPGGQINLIVRTSPVLKAFGTIVGDGLNFLFGSPNHAPIAGVSTCAVNYGLATPSCLPRYYTIVAVEDVVFSSNVMDDWNLYTGELTLSSMPEHLWELYNSDFSGGVCAGPHENFPTNYLFYCNPSQDGDSSAGEFSASVPDAYEFFKRTALTAHRNAMTVPVFSRVEQFVALNAWNLQPGTNSSLVAQSGHGFQTGFWSLLNMRPKPGYTPANPLYSAGGGNSSLIRRGFSQDLLKLSPFFARSPWELDILTLLYDSIVKVNPLTGGADQQVLDWATTTHADQVANGNTVQTWRLRNDLRFHDGTPVTPDDVAFSIMAYREVPSVTFRPKVATVISVSVIASNTLQVTLKGQSPFYKTNIGGIPIIPKHIWQPFCTNSFGITFGPGNRCADPSFDPIAQGITVGSGPWLCKSNTGTVGGPCTSSGTQEITLDGTVALTRYEAYTRCCHNVQGTSLHKESWADKNDDGMVDILDIADAALHFNASDTYWDNALFGITPNKVDIGEIATVAFYFDHSVTSPFLPSQLAFLDPQIDPFFQKT